MSLFSSFAPLSSKQWKQQIQYELKGADYTDSVVWDSPEGIQVRPFYHADQAREPITSGGNDFFICQDIYVFDLEKSNRRAKESISRGANSLRFSIDDRNIDIGRLLDGLDLIGLRLYFKLGFLSREFAQKIDQAVAGKGAQVFILVDPIGHLAKGGNWFPGGDNFETSTAIAGLENCHGLSVDGTLYQNAGANMVQQLAYILSHANEYLNRIPLARPMVLQVAVGPNYFFEIAKLRALRALFNLIENEYGTSAGCHILATPTRRNKTLYDYNVNMLRTTTECMSAILGGADTVSNLPYDAIYHKNNEFGDRIARNQLLILKHESYFGAVTNPADGSYYIESITAQMAEKALALFKEIEASGGLLKQLMQGTIQKKIAESAASEQELFDSGKSILLGTNKHPNKTDRMEGELELFPFVKINPRKTLITPIIERRLAEKAEIKRLELEKNPENTQS